MHLEDEKVLAAWAAVIESPPLGMPSPSDLQIIMAFAELSELNGKSESDRNMLALAHYFLQYASQGEASIEARLRLGVLNFAQASRQ